MKNLHIANINFELMLDHPQKISLEDSFALHTNLLQLQYLPALYTTDPFIATSDAPYTFANPPHEPHRIIPWAHHPMIQKWAIKYGHQYEMPPANILPILASKRFTFEQADQLPYSKLVFTPEDLHFEHYPIVLKSEFGFSGRGHRVYYEPPLVDDFIAEQFAMERPLIAEPWVETSLNFSTHYEIGEQIRFIGACEIINNQRGMFQASKVNHPLDIPDSHFKKATALLKKVHQMGYFGPIGIDGFIYEGKDHICEINPRRTMGRVALDYANGKKMTLRWGSQLDSSTNLLPNHLFFRDRTINFRTKLNATSL